MNDHDYHPCILFTCDPEKNLNYDRDYDNVIIRAKRVDGISKGSFDIRVIAVEKGGIQ